MANQRIFEPRDTVQFTIVTSTSPDGVPRLTIHGIASTAVVNSLTSTASDSTHHYAFVTQPNSEGEYVAEWSMQKTLVSSAFDFVKRFRYRIQETDRGQGDRDWETKA